MQKRRTLSNSFCHPASLSRSRVLSRMGDSPAVAKPHGNPICAACRAEPGSKRNTHEETPHDVSKHCASCFEKPRAGPTSLSSNPTFENQATYCIKTIAIHIREAAARSSLRRSSPAFLFGRASMDKMTIEMCFLCRWLNPATHRPVPPHLREPARTPPPCAGGPRRASVAPRGAQPPPGGAQGRAAQALPVAF